MYICNIDEFPNELKILSLNVCGIKKRLNYPEFNELIKCYDILCFTESKTDDLDTICHEDFVFYAKNRLKFSRVRSGGIIIGIRKSLTTYISPIDTDSRFVFWFSLKDTVFERTAELLLKPARNIFGTYACTPRNRN